MKKHLIIILVVSTAYCNAQSLEKNEVDEFTGNRVKKTSYEVLVQNFKLNAFVSVMSINDSSVFLDLKLMLGSGSVHAIDKDAILYLKMADDSIIELRNTEYSISCRGCGARGFSGSNAQGSKTSYLVAKWHIEKFRSSAIAKFRLYTTDGYIESGVNNNRSSTIKSLLELL